MKLLEFTPQLCLPKPNKTHPRSICGHCFENEVVSQWTSIKMLCFNCLTLLNRIKGQSEWMSERKHAEREWNKECHENQQKFNARFNHFGKINYLQEDKNSFFLLTPSGMFKGVMYKDTGVLRLIRQTKSRKHAEILTFKDQGARYRVYHTWRGKCTDATYRFNEILSRMRIKVTGSNHDSKLKLAKLTNDLIVQFREFHNIKNILFPALRTDAWDSGAWLKNKHILSLKNPKEMVHRAMGSTPKTIVKLIANGRPSMVLWLIECHKAKVDINHIRTMLEHKRVPDQPIPKRLCHKKLVSWVTETQHDHWLINDTLRLLCTLEQNNVEIPITTLKKTHDLADQECRKLEQEDRPLLDFGDWEWGDFKIEFPKSTHQLIEWGAKMNHCIGSYTQDALSGRGIYGAVHYLGQMVANFEIQNKRLRQLHGPCNRSVDEDIRRAVNYQLRKHKYVKG